ncbi:hypothetical protein [Pyxidicoccus sp. MSG2]|uniref:hypothetical protein n=1 Tax=Pyxidicoccus sp. MSG2 TaxID=2996790 RepID=UPI00226DF002|nr:hypothetical protein [Pyxidicoccus sp. MSG2]MCY1019358.1 hypothetical protein [Pyxidicoccus sp. MSG2]
MRRLLVTGIGTLPERVIGGVHAALAKQENVRRVFDRMLRLLKQMHDQNPSWGFLFIRHRGDVTPHFFCPYPSRPA